MPLESIDSWDSIKETNKWLMNCMSDDIENCNGKWKLQTEKGRFEHTAIEIHCGSTIKQLIIYLSFNPIRFRKTLTSKSN